MEQFDTDDKLLENPKKDKNENSKYLLIGVMCLIVIVACIILFKYVRSPAGATAGGSSKKSFFNIYFFKFYRFQISSFDC